MIFRRTNDLSTSKNTANRTTNSGTTATPATRREPEINRPSTGFTPAGTNPSSNSQATTPLTMTQQTPGLNRRTQTPATTGFNRPEQMRKLTVGRDISLNGEITTCDHLIVEGNVVATIKGGQVLEISETGTFSGLVDIEQADVAGIFDGELTVRGKLILRPSAVVTGLIRYGRLQVDAGATLNGQISALPASAEESPMQTSSQTQTVAQSTSQQSTMTSTSYNSLASVNDQPGFLKASA